MVNNEPKEINTGGGAVSEGGVETGGGDFVGRDQYIQYYQLDIPKLVEALKESLPADDPTPQHLLDTLKGFQYYHTRLFEWKELHNFYNDITNSLDQFSGEVEHLEGIQEEINLRALNRRWRQVAQKVSILLDWSAQIKYIFETPFEQSPAGLKGPPWAVELYIAKGYISELLQRNAVDAKELYNATFNFKDVAVRHLYLADKQLRDSATEIYNLSRIVLGSLEND